MPTAAATEGRIGYVQDSRAYALHPAFADFGALEAAVQQAMPGATLQTNPDGTVAVASGAQRWTLTPQMQLETVPEETRPWWVEATARYACVAPTGRCKACGRSRAGRMCRPASTDF